MQLRQGAPSTKCPNPGVALIWATPLPPLRFTPHEHLASHGRAHSCKRSMPREMGSIARLARAQGRCNRFPVFWATFRLRPAWPRAGGPEGPIGSYVVHQWPASGREGFSAAVDRVDRASGHRGRRCLATRARKLSLVHARCCRGASEAAQVGGGARQLDWVRNDDTGRPDPRPTPSRRIVAAAGLWHPISTCPDGQTGEWSPRRRSWSPCLGVA
jgi:hypothetical protein